MSPSGAQVTRRLVPRGEREGKSILTQSSGHHPMDRAGDMLARDPPIEGIYKLDVVNPGHQQPAVAGGEAESQIRPSAPPRSVSHVPHDRTAHSSVRHGARWSCRLSTTTSDASRDVRTTVARDILSERAPFPHGPAS